MSFGRDGVLFGLVRFALLLAVVLPGWPLFCFLGAAGLVLPSPRNTLRELVHMLEKFTVRGPTKQDYNMHSPQ